jgi:LuxR family transcriptional regulator, maltose regulon positive regulatory protein
MGACDVGAGTELLERALTPVGDPIMTAKFIVPTAVNAAVVERRRLLDLLSAAVTRPLTLVHAPAGSGKTVAVSSWVTAGASPGPVTWISLDEEDDLPGVFWTYLVTGLARSGVDVRGVGKPDRPDHVEHSLLVRLAARLSERSEPAVLVLDNAEGLTRQQIGDDLDFLVRHTAGRLRLVVVTRVDANLPLPQYRLQDLVSEVTFHDLAFTSQEAGELLRARRPHLSDEAIAACASRTRGWAAGLLLARAGLRGNPAGEDAVLAASDIAAYFRSEVLSAQPQPVRDLLVSTSVADRLPPQLAIHLSGARDAGTALRALAQAGAFVEPVPGADEAYRYHPLVRDLLRAELREEFPGRWRRLHRKAAHWLMSDGRPAEAAQQYASAGDWADTAGVLVRDVGVAGLLARSHAADLQPLFARMPDDVPEPEAAVAAAAVAVLDGDLDACDKHLLRAQELAAMSSGEGDVALRLAVALTALTRSAAAGGADGLPAVTATEDAVIAAAAARPVDRETAALVSYGTGCAQLAGGDLVTARQTLTSAARAAEDAGLDSLAAAGWGSLALTAALAGRLTQAVAAAEHAAERGPGGQVGSASLAPESATVALAWVASERGELAEAATLANRAAANPRQRRNVVAAPVLALVRSRLLRARGDLPRALDTLDLLTGETALLPDWLEHRVAAAAAGILLAEGRPEAAAARVQRRAADDSACLLALGWVKLPGDGASESGRIARQVMQHTELPLDLRIETCLLAAAAALGLSHPEPARAALDEAARMASAEGVRRPFDEAPRRIRSLVQQQSEHPADAAGVRPPAARAVPDVRPPADLLIQPLTEREREVLGYLDALLPTEEIAGRMFVSVNTVKTHVRAILRKLSAERRNQAVRRARDLGLL